MTSQRDLIDYLTERTGTDPYRLKRLSKNELEQLVAAYKEDQEQFQEMYKTMDDLYETIVGKEEVILEKEEVILEKEEALKPENYLSSRELSDREMSQQAMWLLNYLWNKLTGQPEMPFSFLGIVFGIIVFGTVVLVFYGIVIMPILYLLGMT